MKKFNSIIALLLAGNLLFADVLDLASPGLTASSPYYESDKTTSVALSNPALTADIQRYTFDLNYLLLADIDDGGFGHSIDIGGAIPSKYGVLSVNADLLLTDGLSTSDLYVGTAGNINLNFSKEIYSDLYFGAGLTTIFGSDSSGFDWGLGLNLGFVKYMGDLSPIFKDFKWGVSMLNMGKGYQDGDNIFNSATDIFTPVGFAEFSPYENDILKVNVASEVSAPSLSDLNIELGAKAVLYDDFTFETSTNIDIAEIVDGDLGNLIPSIFLGYNLKLGDDIAQINLAANQYTDNIWAFAAGGAMPLGSKDSNPPEVTIDYDDIQYVSPNFDGTKDELNFPITVVDERYIAGYEVIISDSFDKVVKEIVNKDERPENESIKNLFSKLINPKTGIPVPESFRWDGKKDDGELVQDGDYNFYTTFVDDNGNSTKSIKHIFVIDNTKPEVEISAPSGLDLIFSPNGDGNKDTFSIPQTGSIEVRWYAEVSDFIGNIVKSYSWDNSSLSTFEWDGKNDSGQLVPDGVYQYRVTSTDLAGNSVEDFVDNIIVNTKQPPIGITIDTNTFSPNDDEIKDNMEFILDIPVKTGILKWELDIKNSSGTVVNKFSTDKQGYSVIEDNIRFDGLDSSGNVLPEGSYFGELSVVYQNGHSPKVDSPKFVIDITSPKATVVPRYTMFSPNGDSSKDQIIFNQTSSAEEDWSGEILDEFGSLIYKTDWKGEIDQTFKWNGKNNDGELLDDGLFTYVLSSTDRSGNSYRGDPVNFNLDTTKSDIELTLNRDAFSPFSNKEYAEIDPIVDSSVDLAKYNLEIIDSRDRIIKTLSSNKNIDDKFIWDGLDNSGNKVIDATYFGRISGEFENGNKVVSLTTPLVLDTKKPTASVKLKERFNIFSPNGDGKKDALTFIQNTSDEDEWFGEVKDNNGKSVYTATWSGIAPNEFVFTGKDVNNENLPDGKYTYSLYSVDKAGNRGETNGISLNIDTEDVELFVTTNYRNFSPNSDGNKDTIEFKPQLKKTDGIDSTLYEVFDNKGSVVYSSPDNTIWNGLNSSGKKVADGEYLVKLTVNYKRGDSPTASTGFILDTVAPKADVSVENSIFSPNGDGNRDVVIINNDSDDRAQWTLVINDLNNEPVKESILNGELTESWNFDGRGSDLTLLENGKYYYLLAGVDEAGNSYSSGKRNITMDSTPSSVLVTNDFEVFSPNRDKIKDKVTFTTRVDSVSNVESWVFKIVDNKDQVVKEFKGGKIPKEIVWDGIGISGNSIDGKYRGILNVVHENGNNPSSTTPTFELDSTYPNIFIAVRNPLFSPNSDGLKDSVIFTQTGSGEELYKGVIYDNNNKIVNEWFWKDSLDNLNWDGKDSSGNIAKDGTYTYSVETTDLGGNKTVKRINDITIDTTETDIFITYKKPVFAPDLVSTLGPQTFGLIVNNRDGIESWTIKIKDNKDTILRTLSGRDSVPDVVEWDGKDSSGKYVNGMVKALFNTVYTKGNSPVYSTKSFIADSNDPQIYVATSPTPFSPDNDFVNDELTIELGVKDLSDIDNWAFKILDPKGNEFITFEGDGKPGKKIIWDGKSSKGELVQAAEEYQYIMSVTDAAGHTGVTKGNISVDILVIKDGDKLKIQVSSIIFEPNSSELALSGANGFSNKKILKRLSEILDKYSSYKIVVEGHAHNIYGDDATKRQREGLIDFSKERAEEVKSSLSGLGIAKGRMSTAGIGGDDPLVDFSDVENVWKNRRVEFVLIK